MRPEWEAAARSGDVARLGELLQEGGDVNARDHHGQTALMCAARAGHTAAVGWLASHGADLDHAAKFGLTALMLAIVNGHLDTARALVEAGADLTPRGTGAPGFSGLTARDLAAARGHGDVVDLIDGAMRPNQRPGS